MSKKKQEKKEEPTAPEASKTEQPSNSTLTVEKKKLPGFDLSKFIPKPRASTITLSEPVTQIPVMFPDKKTFFRIHPTIELPEVYIVDWPAEKKTFLVSDEASKWELVAEHCERVSLFLGMTLSGTHFLTFVKLKDKETGEWNSYNRTKMDLVKLAREKWVRPRTDKTAKIYLAKVAEGEIIEPAWDPSLTLEYCINMAFDGAMIETQDHPFIQAMKGKVKVV
jgi:hypothetical protein